MKFCKYYEAPKADSNKPYNYIYPPSWYEAYCLNRAACHKTEYAVAGNIQDAKQFAKVAREVYCGLDDPKLFEAKE